MKILSDTTVLALVIILVFYVIAKLVEWVFDKIFRRITGLTKTEVDDKILDILHRPIATSIILLGASWSIGILPLSDTVDFILFGIIKTLIVLIWGIAAFRMVTVGLEWLSVNEENFRAVQKRTLPLFDSVGKICIFGGASYFLLLSWDVNISAWLASAGIIGIAVGFAARDSLANLFAGIFIMVDAPYKIGDFIVLDSGERGSVTEIGIRSTRILTRDDVEVILPNAVMGNAKIRNESGGPHVKHRVRTTVGVAYGSDIDLVREIFFQIAADNEMVCDDPEPRVRFRTFGESSLNFQLLVWVSKPELRGRVVDALNTAIYKEFNRQGVKIPFPQRDLYIKEWTKEQED